MSFRSASPALGAALLFGTSTPLAELLVGDVAPLPLAGLLYLGSGVGLGVLVLVRRARLLAVEHRGRPDRRRRMGRVQGQRGPAGSLLVLAACASRAIDNDLTRKVSSTDAILVACLKGLLAGVRSTGLALGSGAAFPQTGTIAGSLVVGFFGYGLSLTLFVLALLKLGTARTTRTSITGTATRAERAEARRTGSGRPPGPDSTRTTTCRTPRR